MMLTKKYFSITEVSEITGLPDYKLRYIEKSNNKLKVTKIRGRRYYTSNDIQLIQNEYPESTNIASSKTINDGVVTHQETQTTQNSSNNMEIINEINQLIAKFQTLEKNI
jgi:DNA-binding transcriptional MerR regulator